MEQIGRAVMLLVVVSNALAVDLHRFLWVRNPLSKIPEETQAQVVEVIKWRQPICVMPARGVSPCFVNLRKLQDDYEQVSGKDMELKGEAPWKVTNLRSNTPSKDGDIITSLISPEIVTSVPLSAIQPSELSSENLGDASAEKTVEFQLKTPELTTVQEKNFRNRRYLPARDTPLKPQQIYVTKVLNSPVTASLVAHNCLPDVGLPLCQNYEADVEPSKPVFDSRPSLSISVETESPVTGYGSQGSIWEDPADSFFDSNPPHSFGSNIHSIEANHQLAQNLKPEIIISKPSFGHSATSFAFGGSTSSQLAPGLLHIVTTGSSSHTVTDVDHRPSIVSKPLPSKFSFLERPVQQLTPDQSVKTELSIELAKDAGNEETDASDTAESSISNERSKHRILQVIHDIVNKTEKSTFVQGLQKILLKSSQGVQQGTEATSTLAEGTILGSIFKPGNFFQSEKTMDATVNPETSEVVGADKEESIRQPLLEVEETSTFMDILHKPENDISNIPGLLDVFGQLQDKVDSESLAKPTEKPGLFGDLFANPVRPVILENSNSKS